jgi:hypothetical protein
MQLITMNLWPSVSAASAPSLGQVDVDEETDARPRQ